MGEGAALIVAQTDELEKIDEAISSSTATGWDIAAAIVIVVVAWPVSSVIGRAARRAARRVPSTPDYLPEVVGRAVRWLTMLIAVAWAVSLLGVKVGWFTLIVASVAIIFFLMVRPLVENLAAGLLLQSRPSFGIGDQIETNGYRGDVLSVTARSTILQTRDWKRIHIPNLDVLNGSLDVFTAFERRRSSLDLEIDYGVDPDHAEEVLVTALREVEGVLDDPEPFVLARGFGDSGGTILQVRWWHDPDLRSESRTLDRVVRAIRRALDDAGIEFALPEMRVIGDTSDGQDDTEQQQ